MPQVSHKGAPKLLIAVMIISILILVSSFSSYFIVPEGHRALRVELGKVVDDSHGNSIKYPPGIHVMIPYINTIKLFDTRIRTMKQETNNVYTKDVYVLNIGYYVNWRISDLGKYYTKVVSDDKAGGIIVQQVGTVLKREIGLLTKKSVINFNREGLSSSTAKDAQKRLKQYGIQLVDFRLSKIELNASATKRVHEAMRKKRQKVSQYHISSGRSEQINIQSLADQMYTENVSAAEVKAQKIKAKADQKAADLYADAYSHNPDFYSFYRSLKTYAKVLTNQNSVVILEPNNKLLNAFHENQNQSLVSSKKPTKLKTLKKKKSKTSDDNPGVLDKFLNVFKS
jgi:modulator of FtsH protease HflC